MAVLRLSIFLLLPSIIVAQHVSFGVVGGVPVQDAIDKASGDRSFAVGPTLTVDLTDHLSLQSGVLFYRLGEVDSYLYVSAADGFVRGPVTWKARAIEIPALLRYHLLDRGRRWRPFAAVGPAVRRRTVDYSGLSTIPNATPFPAGSVARPYSESQWRVYPSAGAGVSVKVASRLDLEPEVRYSRWTGTNDLNIRRNQVHFLLGLRF